MSKVIMISVLMSMVVLAGCMHDAGPATPPEGTSDQGLQDLDDILNSENFTIPEEDLGFDELTPLEEF